MIFKLWTIEAEIREGDLEVHETIEKDLEVTDQGPDLEIDPVDPEEGLDLEIEIGKIGKKEGKEKRKAYLHSKEDFCQVIVDFFLPFELFLINFCLVVLLL